MTRAAKHPATLIPGDGIGPEIVEATVEVLEALQAPLEWETRAAGMAGVERHGDPLPAETLDSIRRTKLALKGPLTTPVGGGASRPHPAHETGAQGAAVHACRRLLPLIQRRI